jgi:phosphoglycerate dehydrogenase-like enzyme
MDKKTIRVVMADPLAPEQLAFLQDIAAPLGIELAAPLSETEDELKGLLANAEAVVVQHKPFTGQLMEAAPRLKMIQKMGCRSDGIDVAAARQKNIAVALMSLPGAVAVAEHVLALILALAKKILPGHAATVEGAYRKLGIEPKITTEHSHGFQWMKMNDMMVELRGQTLGIIGFGEIGTEIARRARAFDMAVIYYNRRRLAADLEAELGVSYCPKDELLMRADFVSLNTPLSPETEKSIGARELALMKPTAYLINASRGGVIDEPALVDALRSRKIAGAGLDVFVQEPVPFDHPYLSLDNVVLTPHIAGGKGGARERQPRAVFTHISAYFAGQPIEYRVA